MYACPLWSYISYWAYIKDVGLKGSSKTLIYKEGSNYTSVTLTIIIPFYNFQLNNIVL